MGRRIPNEVLKQAEGPFAKALKSVFDQIWEEEEVPDQWNEGLITNLWKGKGDREVLTNNRGLTVSPTIETLAEDVIDKRGKKVIKFSPAQAGGQPVKSTAEHVSQIITIAPSSVPRGSKSFFQGQIIY